MAPIDAREIGHRSGRIDYLHPDAMGTPRLATDANQQIVWRWKWDAFGDSQVIKGRNAYSRIEMNLRYPGQYYDTETGLFYNWNRYYDPSTGRYGRSDPIGLDGGVNTYVYGLSNPISNSDPSGLRSIMPEKPQPAPKWWPPPLPNPNKNPNCYEECMKVSSETGKACSSCSSVLESGICYEGQLE